MGAVPAHHRRPDETPSEAVDRLPANVRELVHDYGFNVVTQFLNAGIKSPATIRLLIRTVHAGAREPGNQRPVGGRRNGKSVLAHIDTWLVQKGATFTAQMLVRLIRDGGFTVLPCSPSKDMIEASMETVSGYDIRCTRQEKHQRRLCAALVAGDREAWGDL